MRTNGIWFPRLLSLNADAGGDSGGAGDETPPAPKEPTYTKAELDRILADDRKRRVAQTAKERNEIEQQLASVLEGRDLPEGSPLRSQLEELQSSLLSAEEREKKQAKKYSDELEKTRKQAEEWEGRYRTTTIRRELIAAALPKVAGEDPSVTANIIADQLFRNAKVTDDGNVVVEISVDGETKAVTPTEAVAVLEADHVKYGTLFKSYHASGAGSNPTKGGKGFGLEDLSKLSDAQFDDMVKSGKLNDAMRSVRVADLTAG